MPFRCSHVALVVTEAITCPSSPEGARARGPEKSGPLLLCWNNLSHHPGYRMWPSGYPGHLRRLHEYQRPPSLGDDEVYGVGLAHTNVRHDDLGIPAHDLRITVGGGHAGHNGLRDGCSAALPRQIIAGKTNAWLSGRKR